MPKSLISELLGSTGRRRIETPEALLAKAATVAACASVFLLLAAGCQTGEDTERRNQPPPIVSGQPSGVQPASSPTAPDTAGGTNSLVLLSGDTVQIAFVGAPSLDTTQVIRRDGKITLSGIGEFQAAGLTPSEMEKQLLKLYGPQLVTQEVSVTVKSSSFIFYAVGAVSRPGQINSDRHLTPFEAVVQAGFDITKANLKAVRIIRTHPDGRVERFTLNLKKTLQGKSSPPFNLEPLDVIYVPEKFTWF